MTVIFLQDHLTFDDGEPMYQKGERASLRDEVAAELIQKGIVEIPKTNTHSSIIFRRAYFFSDDEIRQIVELVCNASPEHPIIGDGSLLVHILDQKKLHDQFPRWMQL